MRPRGANAIEARLGLNVPYEWWPAPSMVKEIEAAGFSTIQIPSPPQPVLLDPRLCTRHAEALRDSLAGGSLEIVLHAPGALRLGSGEADLAFEGVLGYASEIGAAHVVYHAANLPDVPASEDALLAETRSLARLAGRAERLGLTIAIENLAPVYPGPESLSASPMTLRSIVQRTGSYALGICLDIGHANVIASERHADPLELIEPVLDATVLIHAHDNLGARLDRTATEPALDPLRLDLHLPPGRGTVPWDRLKPVLARTEVPVVLEIAPPRPTPSSLFDQTLAVLGEAVAGGRMPQTI
jgi:sugar phosphate isomerase/epimerase